MLIVGIFYLVFKQVGSGVYGMLSLFPTVGTICVSDADTIKVCRRSIGCEVYLIIILRK